MEPEVLGAIAAGTVTATLSVIAVLRQGKSPARDSNDLYHDHLVRDLKAEIAALKRDLAQSERRVLYLMERLIREPRE